MTEKDVVDFIIKQDKELKETYFKYQELLSSIKNKDKNRFLQAINEVHELVSDYMKTSIKTLTLFEENIDYIENTFNTTINNGIIEGTNNLIKTIKRIGFGYKRFDHFIARIFLIKGIIKG
jgi:transposase